MKTFFRSLTGSRLHGLYTEDSDYDYKTINVSPIKSIISPFKETSGKHERISEKDECSYEFTHFAKLLFGCNPTALEVLWSNSIEVFNAKELFDNLIKERHLILDFDKVFKAHEGYAKSQKSLLDLEVINSRTPKAIVAYIRVLKQGTSLLKTKDFNPEVTYYKDLLLEIKYNFRESLIPEIRKTMDEVEKEFYSIYQNSLPYRNNSSVDFLESLLFDVYKELD